MWQGKKKAVTFSFDDGVSQDLRVIELFKKYGLKGTFNLNSGLFGRDYSFMHEGRKIEAIKLKEEQIPEAYQGHEVAVHTCTHPKLPSLTDEEVFRQVNEDRKALSALVGYEVRGMAYPGGGVNHDDRVVEIVSRCGIEYARLTGCDPSFAVRKDLLRFKPTAYIPAWESCLKLAEEFLAADGEEPKLFYVWGHAHEIEMSENGWEQMEKLCALLAGKEDIFYGTNAQVLLEKIAKE